MFKRMLAVLALMTVSTLGMAADYVAGRDYRELPVQGRLDKPGMIEVREFFWYGCSHCYSLEPYVATWLKTKPANVNFVRSPAALNSVWESNARGYYVAESQGLVEQTHTALFNAIHRANQRLFDKASLQRFYAGYGIDAKNFDGLYNSFAVNGKIEQSKSLAKQYRLEGVPAMVVNGKYVVQGDGGKVMDIVNYLIAKEAAAK